MQYPYETSLGTALAELRHARQLLGDDISAYPTPIAGCDTQFNRLLSDRTRIARAIRAIENEPFVPTPRLLEPGTVLESR